jgi:hypothetical protein
LHPCDTTEKNINGVASCDTTKICSRERGHKSGIVVKMTLRLAGVLTSISFEVKFSRQPQSRWKKVQRKKAGEKKQPYKNNSKARFYF